MYVTNSQEILFIYLFLAKSLITKIRNLLYFLDYLLIRQIIEQLLLVCELIKPYELANEFQRQLCIRFLDERN